MFLTFFYSCQYLVLMKLRCCHINVMSLPSLNPWMTGHGSHHHFFCHPSSVPAYGTVTIAASAFPPLFFESNPIFYLFSILLHSQLFVLFSRQSLFFSQGFIKNPCCLWFKQPIIWNSIKGFLKIEIIHVACITILQHVCKLLQSIQKNQWS